MRRTLVCSLVVVCGVIAGRPRWSAPVTGVRKQADGALVTLQPGVLQLQVTSGAVIHVTYAVGNALPELKSYTVVARPAADTKWEMRETPEAVIVETQSLRVRIDRKTGAVGFFDLMDNPILLESAAGREVSSSTQPGVQGTLVRQSFVLAPDGGIFGLGRHQPGIWDYRGHTVR